MSDLLEVAVRQWVTGGAIAPFPLDGADSRSERTAHVLRESLNRPLPIAVVERVEHVAKSIWVDVLQSGSEVDSQTAGEFSDFFSTLGFLFKYKPYGVKIASPFGYSLFDLKPHEGFSFQLHLEPKLEAFHILRSKAGALLYLSSPDEWDRSGRKWAVDFLGDRRSDTADTDFALRPREGDVATISETSVVHTVLGCFLEEYASTSVDAVERLWDQNLGSELVFPPTHPVVAALLKEGFRGVPQRDLSRTSHGWLESPIDADDSSIVEIADHLFGARRMLHEHTIHDIPSLADGISLVVAVDKPIEVASEGGTWRQVDVGEFRVLAPDHSGRVRAAGSDSTVVAVHQVTRDMITADWTRNSDRV